MKSNILSLLGNRKIQLLIAACFCLFLSFHTIKNSGVSLQSSQNINEIQSYASISQIINDNYLVSDIQIRLCLRGLECQPPTPSSKNSKWQKIQTKLNLYPVGFSLYNYYLYIEKTPKNDVSNYLTEIKFTLTNESPFSENSSVSHKVSSSLYIWINYTTEVNLQVPVIRDVTLLFGTHDMKDSRRHWRYYPEPINLPVKQSVLPHISVLAISVKDELTVFREEQEFETLYKKNSILVTVDSTFKVMQLSDLHMGQDMGRCHEGGECKFDLKTMQFIETAIKTEATVKLVVVTGDMIDFERTRHVESAVLKALSPILEAGVPFVFTFGDSDWDWDRYHTKVNMLNFVASLPKCYNRQYDELDHRLHGLTNENIRVFRLKLPDGQNTYDFNSLDLNKPDAIITVLDSEYAQVDATQSSYMYRISKSIPDSMEHRLLFFHYPLPNFRPDGPFKLIGSYNEKHKLVTDTDKQFLDDAVHCKYKAISVGHEHENDACIWKDVGDSTVLLCYSGIAGDSGAIKIDEHWKCRLRLFDINFDSNRILSWKRLANNEALDPQGVYPLK